MCIIFGLLHSDRRIKILNICNVRHFNAYLISIKDLFRADRTILALSVRYGEMSNMNTFLDSRNGYGLISRAFHWLMALLFLWQFISAILRVFAKDTMFYNFFWSAHHQLGFALLVLVLLRGLWGLLNINRRPHKQGRAGKLVALGHLLIYGLMFAVPAVALLRTFGSGRGFSFLGIQIFEQTGVQNAALTAPGNALHGLLGWLLLAVIAGHALMALVHHFALRDDTLRYMTGRKALS